MKSGWNTWSRVYRVFEFLLLGRSLQRARQSGIEHLDGGSAVLLLGDGDGRFLEAALARNPGAEFTSIDGSAGMLARSQERNGDTGSNRVRWHQLTLPASAADLPLGPFDRIVTQFFLDCFTEEALREWWPEVAARLQPGGAWWVTDFTPAKSLIGFRRRRQAWLLSFLYAVFQATTPMRAEQMPPIEAPFQEAGWMAEQRWQSPSGVFHSTLWRKPCLTP